MKIKDLKAASYNKLKIKDVPGFSFYQCTEDGLILSTARPNTITLKPKEDRDGYLEVTLFCNGARNYFKVHQVVAITWHGDQRGLGYCVNHKNGNKKDNHKDNLEWMLPAENERHARSVLGKRCLGEKASRSKLKNDQIPLIKEMVRLGIRQNIVAEKFHISQSQVSRVYLGTNWSHIGGADEKR